MSSGVGPSPPTTITKSGFLSRSSSRPEEISPSESVTVRILSIIVPIPKSLDPIQVAFVFVVFPMRSSFPTQRLETETILVRTQDET